MGGHQRGRLRCALLLLLVVRVIGAPVALHPSPAGDASLAGLLVRVCAWPAQHDRATSRSLTIGERTLTPSADANHEGPLLLVDRSALRADHRLSVDRSTRFAIARLRC